MQGFALPRLKKERTYYPGNDHSTNELLVLCRLVYMHYVCFVVKGLLMSYQ